MRQSLAAVALIRREQGSQTLWLAQWNSRWGAYHFVAGHKRPEESFRECLVREIGEELRLTEGAGFRILSADPTHLDFVDFSVSTRIETRYIMELFDVELTDNAALRSIAANPENSWLSEVEIHSGHARDGRPVSPTMKRLLETI